MFDFKNATVHIHIHQDISKDITEILNLTNTKLNNIMATLQEFRDAFAEINEATSNISADIVRLTEQLSQSGLSAADEDAALTELKGIAQQLKDIAAVTPEGTPTPPPAE